MAEQENILTKLGKLFQSSIILRKTDSGKIKVKEKPEMPEEYFWDTITKESSDE